MNASTEPANEPESTPEIAPMGFPQRLIGIFFSPGQVFQNLKIHPSYLLPMIVYTLITLSLVPVMAPLNEKAAIEQMRQQNPAVTQEQIDQVASFTSGPTGIAIGMVSTLIIIPIIALLMTLIFRTVFQAFFGGDVSFRHAFSVLTHANLLEILGVGVAVGMTLSTEEVGASLNLGVLVPFLEQDNIIYIILKGIDVFTGWWLCLLSIGFGILYGLPTMRAAKIFFGMWALWIAGKTVFVLTFGSIIPGL